MKRMIAAVLLLTAALAALPAAIDPELNLTFVVIDDNVNVRAAPNVGAKVVGKLKKGDIVHGKLEAASNKDKKTVGGTENFWCKVQLDEAGATGFAWGEFLAQVIERASFNGQDIWAVSHKPVFGMYLNTEFRTESLGIIRSGVYLPLKFDTINNSLVQNCAFIPLGGKLCLLTIWEFNDAEARSRAFGLYELNLETGTATLLGSNL